MRLPSILLHLVALIAIVVHAVSAAVAECFYPDGTSSGSGLVPCNTSATHSHCCRDSDLCLTNGFCFSFGLNALVRRGCTDSSWNSSKCADQCSEDSTEQQYVPLTAFCFADDAFRSADVVMTICDQYTMFCCGQDAAARNCCTSGNGTVRIIPGEAMPPVTTQSGSSTTTCPAPKDTSGEGEGCGSQKNTTIAVGAALGAATLIAAALGALFFKQRRDASVRETAALGREDVANRQNQELLNQQRAAAAREEEVNRQNQELLIQQQAAAAREEDANRRYQELLNQRRVFE